MLFGCLTFHYFTFRLLDIPLLVFRLLVIPLFTFGFLVFRYFAFRLVGIPLFCFSASWTSRYFASHFGWWQTLVCRHLSYRHLVSFGFSFSGESKCIVGGARGWSRAPEEIFSAPPRAPQRMRPGGGLVPPLIHTTSLRAGICRLVVLTLTLRVWGSPLSGGRRLS